MYLGSIREFCKPDEILRPRTMPLHERWHHTLSARPARRRIPDAKELEMGVALETVESLYPFVLTEEQEHLRREIREFAAREIAPNVMAWDEASEFPHAVVKKLGAMGLLGVIFPPEYGGAGLGYVDYVLAIEELSAVDGSIGIIVAAHNSLGTSHIFLA